MALREVVEAMLFAANTPLLPKEIVRALRKAATTSKEPAAMELAKVKAPEVAAVLQELKTEYDSSGRAFHLAEQSAGWQVLSRPEYSEWIRQLYPDKRGARLSTPALETLAIVAYRQPITRADIEAVRGVSVDGVMQTLTERGFVQIAGRAETAGRPLLYETSPSFLEHFGLKDLDGLPNAGELRKIELPKAEARTEQEPTPEPEPAETSDDSSTEEENE